MCMHLPVPHSSAGPQQVLLHSQLRNTQTQLLPGGASHPMHRPNCRQAQLAHYLWTMTSATLCRWQHTYIALSIPMQDHLTGKQYLGWKAIREKHKEMLEKMEKQSTTGRGSREPEEPRSNDRERVREKERERSPRSRCVVLEL